MDLKFGKDVAELCTGFFNLRPNSGEASEKFVLCVERRRRMLSIPGDNLAHTFQAYLSCSFKKFVNHSKLDLAMNRTQGSTRPKGWGWKDVVTLAQALDGKPTLIAKEKASMVASLSTAEHVACPAAVP